MNQAKINITKNPLKNNNIVTQKLIYKFTQYCKFIDLRTVNTIKKYDLSKYGIETKCYNISENILGHIINKYVDMSSDLLVSPQMDNFMKIDIRNTLIDFYNNYESYLHGDVYNHEGVYIAEANCCISNVENMYRLHDNKNNIIYTWAEFTPMNVYYIGDDKEGMSDG